MAWSGGGRPRGARRVPSLLRLLLVGGVLAAVAFGAMTAMVTYLRPEPHDITQPVALPAK